MAEQDALSTFDFNKVTGGGLYLKFKADNPVTIRVLTTDPLVSQQEYENKATNEKTVSTKFAFIVYNWTEEKAQILQATGNMAQKISNFHTDPDFGGDIKKIDIKITPTGEMLERRYDIQVLPQTKELTQAIIKECAEIKLEEKIEDGTRLSEFETMKLGRAMNSGYENAKAERDSLAKKMDIVIEPTDDDEIINLDDIPF